MVYRSSLTMTGGWQQFWGTCTSRSCVTTPLGSDCGVFVFIKRSVRKSEVPMIINASAKPCVVSAQRDLSVLTALFIVCVCSALYIYQKKKKSALLTRKIIIIKNDSLHNSIYTFPVFSNQKWQLSGFLLSLWVVRVCVTLGVVVCVCVCARAIVMCACVRASLRVRVCACC